jgi:prepilin-type N-terminal cleavage/methylation domain-containing protein
MQLGRRGGFTLIELVLSAALMSMILGATYLCLRAGFASQALAESHGEALQNGRIAITRITADLRSACSLTKEFDFIGMQRTIQGRRADNLDFATHHYRPVRAHEGDWCEVSYFLDKSSVGRGLSLWRRRDPSPDDAPFEGGTREEIAQSVVELRFEYYDGFEWYDEWGDPEGKKQSSLKDQWNLTGWPEAVRVTLSIEPRAKNNMAPKPESPEPPLVFQTVARLNLAGAAELTSGGTGGGMTNAVGPAAAAPAPAPNQQ